MEREAVDRRAFPLYSVEDHLAGKAPYISAAMDNDAFPYGTALYIPEICEAYGVPWDELTFLVVDTGGAFIKPGVRDRTRIDICVDTRAAGLSKVGNMKPVTLCVMEVIAA
jgi:3D (Asp-Asp-Asp) domain-containing protein